MEDADLALRVRIDDGLGQFGPHAVEAVDDGRNGAEVRLLADHGEGRMVDLSAAVAVDLLPVVAEEPELRRVRSAKKVVLDGVNPAGVCVLVLVDQDDRISVGQDAPEFGVVHERDG